MNSRLQDRSWERPWPRMLFACLNPEVKSNRGQGRSHNSRVTSAEDLADE